VSPAFSLRALSRQSDARLFELARQGNERAFEALVQRHQRDLLAYARRLVGSTSRAEDAFQQSLLAAWLALQRGYEVRDGRRWLYRIVHNVSLNSLREGGLRAAVELSEALPAGEGADMDAERRLRVREALAGLAELPPLQREALLRTAVQGRSRDEVAVELGLSAGAVRGLAYRARTALRATMTALLPTPFGAWAAALGRGAGADGPLARLGEVAGGGGSAGLAAVLLKGGAAALTASAVVAGVAGVAGTSRARHASRPHVVPALMASRPGAPAAPVTAPRPAPVASSQVLDVASLAARRRSAHSVSAGEGVAHAGHRRSGESERRGRSVGADRHERSLGGRLRTPSAGGHDQRGGGGDSSGSGGRGPSLPGPAATDGASSHDGGSVLDGGGVRDGGGSGLSSGDGGGLLSSDGGGSSSGGGGSTSGGGVSTSGGGGSSTGGGGGSSSGGGGSSGDGGGSSGDGGGTVTTTSSGG
jgi:RNA polymerase sigma factor (sigma-70 family)